jgi:hypothetical protein
MVFDTYLHKPTTDYTDLHGNLTTLKIRAKIGVEKSREKIQRIQKNFSHEDAKAQRITDVRRGTNHKRQIRHRPTQIIYGIINPKS